MFANGGAADLVIGQPDFFTATCNPGGNIEVIRQFLEVQIDLVEEPKGIWTISFDGTELTIGRCDPVTANRSERVLFNDADVVTPCDSSHSRASNSENSGNSRLVRQRP